MDKKCEICGKPLTGKQTRSCSIRCRNVIAGRASVSRFQMPDRTLLAAAYLLPPEGRGLTFDELGKEFGASEVTVRKWLKSYGLYQGSKERLGYFSSLPHPWRRKAPPLYDELAKHYLMPPDGEGLSEEALSSLYGVSRPTISRWLKEYDLMQKFEDRHSQRMSGTGNPAYVNGNSGKYVSRKLAKVKPKVCEWCGATERIHVHHIDHNHEHNDPDNLMWLCMNCNLLESRIWQLEQANRIKTTHVDNRLIIEFVERSI